MRLHKLISLTRKKQKKQSIVLVRAPEKTLSSQCWKWFLEHANSLELIDCLSCSISAEGGSGSGDEGIFRRVFRAQLPDMVIKH